MDYKKSQSGVTLATGFQACGIAADIKGVNDGKKDLALLYSAYPAVCAGVYTQNKYAAAPVKWCKKVTDGGKAQAVVINSGNANACTGEKGDQDAKKTAETFAGLMEIPATQVLVASTGVIGVELPMAKIEIGIEEAAACLSPEGGKDAALAIMTTDTFSKESGVEFALGDKKVRVGGMAKGSGMIHPNMATMLGFVASDIAISAGLLQKALTAAADKSFNMITVDGDTSTNDSLLVLANGAAGNDMIEDENDPGYQVFLEALTEVCTDLAKMMAKDGEGATKFLEVKVVNAGSEADARKAARAVAGSNLVKAAFFGEDANWGRIICAVGYSGAEFIPDRVEMLIRSAGGEETMMKAGAGLKFDEDNTLKVLQEKDIQIVIDFHEGNNEATAWGCDLTYDYVKINGDYRT